VNTRRVSYPEIPEDLRAAFFVYRGEMEAIKAVGDWELDVLGVPFGGPDNGRDREDRGKLAAHFLGSTEIASAWVNFAST
jgi:hypothetical protein